MVVETQTLDISPTVVGDVSRRNLVVSGSREVHPRNSLMQTLGAANSPIRYFQCRLADLDLATREAWAELESHTNSPNVFLSRAFNEAAFKNLADVRSPLAIWGETTEGRMVSWGLFEAVPPTPFFPFPLLRSWQTPYTFRDGMLLARGVEQQALDGFWDAVRASGWHAVELPRLVLDSPKGTQFMESSIRCGLGASTGRLWQRAMLSAQHAGPAGVEAHCSSKRTKSLRRGRQWLERSGPVQLVVQRDSSTIPAAIETLLHLESLGWKGDVRTALLSDAAHARFFRELCHTLSEQGELAFVELRVGQEVVASLSLLMSGDRGFAFKIGWNPHWERGCPGFLLMAELALQMRQLFPGLQSIDSCSSPNSFISHVWPDTSPVGCCLFPLRRRARMVLQARNGVRALKDFWKSLTAK